MFYASSRRLQSLSMTSADLCAMYKPWPVQQTVVSTIMDEFWEEVCFLYVFVFAAFFFVIKNERDRKIACLENFILIIISIFIQGDEEKRQGIQPQSLMDRSLAHELPKNQVTFSILTFTINYMLYFKYNSGELY